METESFEVKDGNTDLTGTKMDIEKTGTSRSITGAIAETIVYNYLKHKANSLEEVDWDSENADADVNPSGRAGLGYDIKYKKNGITYFVEVKGTKKYTEKLMLHFSKNEIRFAQKHQETYKIMICNGTEEENPKIQIIDNLFTNHDLIKQIKVNDYIAIPSGYEIYLKITDK